MQIKKQAVAGTLESSDVLVEMRPGEKALEIEIHSPVLAQYGDSIRACVHHIMDKYGVRTGYVKLEDRGALECTLNARIEACLLRAADEKNEEGGKA